MSEEALRAELKRTADAMRALKREVAALRQENEELRAGAGGAPDAGGLRFVVSPRRALSVYGLGKLPTTLYRAQWLRLLDASRALRAFLDANAAALGEPGAPRVPAPPVEAGEPPDPRQQALPLG